MLTLEELRKISEKGEIEMKNIQLKKQAEKLEKQRLDDLKEAQERITEAENRLAEVAKRGERSVDVCVLRRGIHFTKKFDSGQNPKFLGLIGKTIYDHFYERGLKVSFLDWQDGLRMGESEDEAGYRVVVSFGK